MNAHSHLFGFHAIFAALENHTAIETLLALKDRIDPKMQKLLNDAKAQGIAVRLVERKTLDGYGKSHQGVVALLRENAEPTEMMLSLDELLSRSLNQNRLILALDGITDPHNLGACIRSAEALGADGVIIPKDKSAPINAAVHKTSSGASQILPIVILTNLSESLKKAKEMGFWLIGLTGEADTDLPDLDFSAPTILILGNEGSGLRRLTKEHCDFLARIPMRGKTESLNVSVSAGIGLFEVLRQRAL